METKLLRLLEKTRRIGTWVVDVGDAVCRWSETTYDIHEEDPKKPIALADGINYYVPEHRPIIERCVQDAIQRRKPWDIELQILTTRGNVRWVRAIGEPVFDGDDVVRLQGMFEDIHARKSLEVEREELFRRMVEAERIAKLGHWKWTLSSDQIEWSPGMYRIHGLEKSSSIPAGSVRTRAVHPDDVDRIRHVISEAARSKEPYRLDFRLVVGGETKYIREEGFPQRDPDGQTTSFVGVAIDLTQRETSKQYIEDLNRRLTLALEASKMGVWEWDIVNDNLIWDPQMYSLYGVRADDFSGAYSAWEQGLHPDDKDTAARLVREAVDNRHKLDTQFRVIWPASGEIRTIRAMGSLQLDSNDQPHTLVGMNWDVTEAEKTKRELERSNQELAQLAYRTSHDLKAPLTTIKGLARYVAMDIAEGNLDEATRNTDVIIRQAASLEHLVLGILEVAKADLAPPPPEECDFVALVNEVVEGQRTLYETNGVTVETEIVVPHRYLLPQARVYQILTNLVSNAIKYADPTKDNRYVRVSVHASGPKIVVTVEDNGCGIPEGSLAAIYNMFQTFHAASGSGIGLHIVKKHVEALEGEITVESSPNGTAFRVEFLAPPVIQ